MRTPGPIRRHARPARLLAGLVIAVPLMLASAGVASATTGGIAQQSPTQGATLAGTAFTGQLQVSGASGTVTFVQTAGAGSVTVSSSGQVSAAGTLAAGTYTAAGTDSDTSADTGTWTFALTVLQPAPSGFSTTLVSVYQSEYGVTQQLGQASALQSVSAYQQQVSQLSPIQLGVLYDAVQQYPEWYQIPALMQTVASGIPAGGVPSPTATASPSPTATASTSPSPTATASTSPSPTASASTSPSPTAAASTLTVSAALLGSAGSSTSSSPAPFVPQACPPGIPDAAIFALQIVIDVSQGVYNAASALIGVLPKGFNVAAYVTAEVAAAVLLAAAIAHDSLSYAQQLNSDCSANNQSNEIGNIDNTTYQTYSLLTSVASSVAQLQATGNTTQQDVKNVQSGLTTVQNALSQTIASDTQTLQSTVGSDTQGLTSQLQTDLTGLQQDLTAIEGDASTLSQQVGQLKNGTTAIESALSSDLAKILSEIDTTAGGLNTLITQDNQQVLSTLKSNFDTQQAQYEANLKLRIERDLAGYGTVVPQVQFMLPASQGGYLNSTPVGVQEVVTDDLTALQALGAKITPAALNNLDAANTALAAGQYLAAYDDYASCYVAIAG